MLALLVRDGMRGFGGVSKSEFYTLSWREIFESYFAEFTEDGELVTWRQRLRRLAGELTGDPDQADRELPSVESLDIPPVVLTCGVPLDYTLMFWGLWRKRGMVTEYILDRWWEMCDQYQPPKYTGRPKHG